MTGWRTVDLVVTATIGVVFGVVFWAWGFVFSALTVGGLSPATYLVSGVWLIPAVLAPLLVRRPGAGILAEMVAAIVSALFGSAWGLDVVISGFLQGVGAELVFAATLYRSWRLPVALLAGAGAAIGEFAHDVVVWFPDYPAEFKVALAAWMIVSGMVLAGIGSWALMRAMLPTGVLDGLAAGREQSRS